MTGAIAAIVSAVIIGIMVFNVVTRPELHDPVPIEDTGHAQPPAWVASL